MAWEFGLVKCDPRGHFQPVLDIGFVTNRLGNTESLITLSSDVSHVIPEHRKSLRIHAVIPFQKGLRYYLSSVSFYPVIESVWKMRSLLLIRD